MLIIVEGCDGSGKSVLVTTLLQKFPHAETLSFPARETAIGGVINKFLKKEISIPPESAHLLFSANRWEFKDTLWRFKKPGTLGIIDRYSHSGVVYSTSQGLDMEWCWWSEKGLPVPDVVIHCCFESSLGNEKYETVDFQKRVKATYSELYKTKGPFVYIPWDGSDVNIVLNKLPLT